MIWVVSGERPDCSMLSAIISTRESERSLVPTLNALFPGAMTGLLTEVIVADGGSRDATPEVADIAGCRFLSSDGALGERLKAAADSARGAWLLFLPAGSVLDARWVDAVQDFIGHSDGRAAVFGGPSGTGLWTALRRAINGPAPENGLLISRRDYDAVGGHPPGDDSTALHRRLGRRRMTTLPVPIRRYT